MFITDGDIREKFNQLSPILQKVMNKSLKAFLKPKNPMQAGPGHLQAVSLLMKEPGLNDMIDQLNLDHDDERGLYTENTNWQPAQEYVKRHLEVFLIANEKGDLSDKERDAVARACKASLDFMGALDEFYEKIRPDEKWEFFDLEKESEDLNGEEMTPEKFFDGMGLPPLPGMGNGQMPPGFTPPPGMGNGQMPPGFTPPPGMENMPIPPGFAPPGMGNMPSPGANNNPAQDRLNDLNKEIRAPGNTRVDGLSRKENNDIADEIKKLFGDRYNRE